MRYIISFLTLFLSVTALGQNPGDTFFAPVQVHQVYFTFSQPGYWDSLTANYTSGTYMKAAMTVDGISYPEVGVKFKGNSSYNNPSDKKPFKIDMNEYIAGQDIDGLKKFNLNNNFKDPSFLREKLTLDFYRDHGLHSPRCAFAKVYINGTYWGLYNFVEEVDVKQFLNTHFNNNEGNLFKGDPHGNLRWLGSNLGSYYTEYELHTNETANNWTDLLELINKINNSGSYFYDSLESIFNTTEFIGQWAVLNIFANLDSYLGSGHNYYIYHDTITGKFEWIAWDANESFGNFKQNLTTAQILSLSMFYINNTSLQPLTCKMLNNPAYKNQLIDTICSWLQFDFSNAALDGKIDDLANLIRPAVYADTKKTTTNQNFETNLVSSIILPGPGGEILGLKSFISNRRGFLINELTANGCLLSVPNTAAQESIKIYPNPASDYLTIESTESAEIKLTNALGQTVLEQKMSGKTNINISGLPSGLYYLYINGAARKKLSILR